MIAALVIATMAANSAFAQFPTQKPLNGPIQVSDTSPLPTRTLPPQLGKPVAKAQKTPSLTERLNAKSQSNVRLVQFTEDAPNTDKAPAADPTPVVPPTFQQPQLRSGTLQAKTPARTEVQKPTSAIPSILSGRPVAQRPVATQPPAETRTQETRQAMPSRAPVARPSTTPSSTSALTARSTVQTGTEVNIASRSPLVTVQANGPKTIGVGKTGTYQIRVGNGGAIPAGGVVVSFEVPDHIELTDSNVTTGATEFSNEGGSTKVTWTLDGVDTNSQETLALKVVPRKAIAFELDLDWRFVPINGTAQVQVTEPRLGMEITGSSEVKYGEKAIYTITVINSGTGDAEGVLVALSEMLGGEQASVGIIKAGTQKQFEVELVAREAGELELGATVSATGGIRENSIKKIIVRRAKLVVKASGPEFKYAGNDATYEVTVTNMGDTAATNVIAAAALPIGAEYVAGVDGAAYVEGGDGLRWNVGTLAPNAERTYRLQCKLNTAGNVRLEAGVRADTELAAADVVQTVVEALADLTLVVKDPRGPQRVSNEIQYEIVVKNRGTKEARDVKIVGQFSPGIEPTAATGNRSEILPGQVVFDAIPSIRVGQEIVLKVRAKASKAGTHIFRAELNCAEQDIRRVSEGTTKFFGLDSKERIADKPSAESLKMPLR